MSFTSTVIGRLACQKDSYLKTLKTTVVSCTPAKDAQSYLVELKDTVLFPEGGGQPNDRGTMSSDNSSMNVIDVQRDGLRAIHHVKGSVNLSPGAEVTLELDWKRRIDHMQQHTGQHLLSAVLDLRNLETLGWNMGTKMNYIELPRKLTDDEVKDVQSEVNTLIQKRLPITVEADDNAEIVADKGAMRVIHIGQMDSNPCCGTHLENTSEIAAVALYHSQSIRGTNSRLFFMCGERVANYASECAEILRKAGALLSCQPEEVDEKVSRLQSLQKESNAREKALVAQLAKYEAADIAKCLAEEGHYVLYKPTATADYLRAVEKELGKIKSGSLVLACGQGKDGGAIVVLGDHVEEIAAKIKEGVAGVKGGGKGKWQGKVTEWNKGEAENLVHLFDIPELAEKVKSL